MIHLERSRVRNGQFRSRKERMYNILISSQRTLLVRFRRTESRMHLKNQVEWALHCCAMLAGLPPDRYLATKALAEFHGVPKEYLSKALQSLSQASLVESTLGPTGGYRLAKPPEKVTFLDIIEAVEGKQSTFQCSEIRANNPCRKGTPRPAKPCAIARIMWEADEAWRSKLRSVRLSDLITILGDDVSPKLWAKSFEWLLAKTP